MQTFSQADDRARAVTTALCERIQPGGADVSTVLRVYDWVRANLGAGEGDVDSLARRWQEQQNSPDDWMVRAFGG